MVNIVLSTGNIIGAAAASVGFSATQKSNQELTRSLRMNIEDAQHDAIPQANGSTTTTDNARHAYDWKRWTDLRDDGKTLYVPAIDFSESSLAEEREQYDITVKLFYLRSATPEERERHTRDAVNLVLKELHMSSIDLLIVSFPGVYFDEETEDCPNKIRSRGPPVDAEPLESLLQSWNALEKLHAEGVVLKLGVAEFGPERLEPFLKQTRTPPAVDQINLRDCCSVPQPLMSLAKSNGVDLLVHNDCTNILPKGTVRELLGQGESGAGVLAGSATTEDVESKSHKSDKIVTGIKGEVTPQWVVKYTAVVRNRGVVENKGYFAQADVTT
ncbi:putative gamma-cysteine synthetase regulatory subunit [Myriangium duriaei CBS 260.36]|uniref:GCS light chain n=1 Tax=Myriangium duriaei CBS 260.36 TaxID=1168546 RepID=A0A9P4MNP8_9PEZI|nr:putative gamma-cysteine synthetase regulatory subunit [Myriangium duriaei CBS 260.36]